MRDERLIFAVEGLPAKALRQIHQNLAQDFSSVKVIERVTDVAFSSLSDFDLAIFWCPKDRERAESFIRNIQLRSKAIPIHLFCKGDDLRGIDNGRDYQNVKRCDVRSYSGIHEIVDIVISEEARLNNESKSIQIPELTPGTTDAILILFLRELSSPLTDFSQMLHFLEKELKAEDKMTPSVSQSFEGLSKNLWNMQRTILSVQSLINPQTENNEAQETSISGK